MHSSQVDQLICSPYVYHPWNKKVKHFTKTANSDSKSENLHDDSIHCQNTKQNLRCIQRKNENPSTKSNNLNYLNSKFNALEQNIPYNSKAVSAELYEKFNPDIRTTLKNQTLDQTLKQIHLSEVMGNIQYSFSIDQQEKLKKFYSIRMSKYNTDIKDNFIYLIGGVLKMARRKLI